MADAPPPWEDSDESEEEQHNAWNQLLELFTLQGSSPKIQRCLKEEDVPFRTGRHLHVHGVVTGRGSNPGEIGKGAHDCKQGFLLERRALLVAASDVVHSFS